MKLSSREAVLGWAVGILVLASLTYWFAAPRARIWMENRERRRQVAERIVLQQALLASREEWVGRLEALKTRLARYEAAQDVTADYLKILERIAGENRLRLVRRQPQKEKRHGDLYERAIDCTWEGSLDALVRFLFALGKESVAMDIEDLTVSMIPGGKNELKGNFTLMCVYSRAGGPPPEAPAAPAPPKPGPDRDTN